MGFFGKIGGFFGGLIEDIFGPADDFVEEKAIQALQLEYTEKLETLKPFVSEATKRHDILLENNLSMVPAESKYQDQTMMQTELQLQIDNATEVTDFSAIDVGIAMMANSLDAYLNDETSNYDYAIWWKAKMVDALVDHGFHIYNKQDETASIVWEAMRRYMELDAARLHIFGSDNAYNMLYDAVEDGFDPDEYLAKVMEIDYLKDVGGDTQYDVEIPFM